MKIVNLAAAAVFATMAASAASAATYGTIPGSGSNQALPALGLDNPLGGYYGASLYLHSDSDVTVEFLGREANYNNSFYWGDDELFENTDVPNNTFNNNPAPPLSTVITGVMTGLLDFAFGIRNDSSFVSNGANPDGSATNSPPNFFVSFADDPEATFGSIVYLFLDDGAQGDDNHDDMVIRLSTDGGRIDIAPIPVPAAGFLLLGGLGALGAMARRRKSA